MIQKNQRGVIYVATGEKYLRAAIRSAWSVRRRCPDLPIHLFRDARTKAFLPHLGSPFHSCAEIEKPHRRSKVDCLHLSPFVETLFLDSDTLVMVDIREVFELLEKFDIALAHHVIRNMRTPSWKRVPPPSYPEFNTGVILYRNNPAVIHLLKTWSRHYHQAGFPPDQITLRELLWETNLQVGVLPPEYNTVMLKYALVWRKGEAVPKIRHFRKYHEGRLWVLCGLRRALVRVFERATGKSKFLVRD